jgi:spoIIIJ-associated protein
MDEHTLEPVDDEPVGNKQSDEGDRLDEHDPGDDPVAGEPVDDELDEDDLPDEAADDELDEDDLPDEPGDDELDEGDLADEPVDDELDDDDLVDGNAAAFSAAPHRDLADEHGDDDLATVAGGATIEEAKRKALEQLRKIAAYVNEAEVEFIVLDEGQKGGFLGMGRTQPRVEARLSSGAVVEPAAAGLPPAAGALQEFLEEVISLMGLDAAIETSDTAEAVSAQITGDDLGILIGRHGQTLDALQYLAAIVVNGDRRQRRQVIVDAEGYRQRREVTLRALAERTAQKVSRGLAPVTLQPMTAAERKIIHLHLKDNPRVETASEGQEPNRAVVVSPRRRS